MEAGEKIMDKTRTGSLSPVSSLFSRQGTVALAHFSVDISKSPFCPWLKSSLSFWVIHSIGR